MITFGLSSSAMRTLADWSTRLRGFYREFQTFKTALGGQLLEDLEIDAGDERAFEHTLGRIPRLVIFTKRSGGHVDDGDTPNTATTFYLKNKSSSVTATVSVLVIP